jgi:AbrB family looped-hinge helix DNA binding protein
MKNLKKLEISKKGQLLIPKYYRDRSGIKPGSKVALIAERHRLIVSVLPEDPVEAACGFLKGGPSLTAALRKERKAQLEKEKKKVRR